MRTGIVVGQSIGPYRGSPVDLRLLQVQLLGDSPETVVWYNGTGEDTAPVNGDLVVVFDLGGGFKITMGTKDQIVAAVSDGEKKVYSRDAAGVVVATMYLKDDGTIQVDCDSDFLVEVAGGKKISLGDGTNELLDLMDQIIDEVITLVSATNLNGTVDLGGAASTGTLFKITAGLTGIENALNTIKTKLGTIKV